jgi:hypothetical protein
MKKIAALAAVVVMMLAGSALVHAGVVVDEQQVVDQPNGNKITQARTVMIEGDRQKSFIDNGDRTVITDLGKGTMTMVDSARKIYVEFPFPPKSGPMAAMSGSATPTVTFKRTGARDKVIGYSCDVYTGSGTVSGRAVSMTGCFSDSAPGASDFSAFQRKMADKVKGTAMANMGQIPPGVPLRMAVTTTMGNIPTTGMSPEQAAKLQQMLANRQFVTKTTVAKISTKSLPAGSFEVPSDYQKQQMPMMSGGPGTSGGAIPPAAGGTAPRRVPE